MSTDETEKLPLQEAHFFWMTRSLDEFLFGRDMFSQIVSLPQIRNRAFLHLHATSRESDKDSTSFLFREALKRQSSIDRKKFQEAFKSMGEKARKRSVLSMQLPCCWPNGTQQDVLWVGNLVDMRTVTELHEELKEKAEALAANQALPSNLRKSSKQISNRVSEGRKSKATSRRSMETHQEFFSSDMSESFSRSSGVIQDSDITEDDLMLPVVFGRPDFGAEIRSIGKARPEFDVDVYICGNDAIVKSLLDTCTVCTHRAKEQAAADETGQTRAQKYFVHYERFG